MLPPAKKQEISGSTVLHCQVFGVIILIIFLLNLNVSAADDFAPADETILPIEEFIEIKGLGTTSEPPVSGSGDGRIYFNSTDGKFKFSQDGGAYSDLGSGSEEFSDGGEARGADRSLGNTDSFDLDILTDGASRIKIKDDGKVGIGLSDPDLSLEVNGAIKSQEVDNATAAVINVDWAAGNQQTVTLNQAGHTVTFANVFAGQIFRLIVCQDGVGSRTISTWPSSVKFAKGVTTPNLSTDPNTCDVFSFLATDASGIPGSLVILGTTVRGFGVL